MAIDLTNAVWNKSGVTIGSTDVLNEDATNGRHSVYQDIQSLVNSGFGTSGIVKARIQPITRTKCWIGLRQNNGFFRQSFDLTGNGAVLTGGSNVTSASITYNGDNTYTCTAVYSGTFSSINSVVAIGGLIIDDDQDYQGVNGTSAIRIVEAQLIKGTTTFGYVPTTTRDTYVDQQAASGQQDASLPSSLIPDIYNPLYNNFSGDNGLTITDFTYGTDAFTAVAVCDWNGTTPVLVTLLGHTDLVNQQSWRMTLTSTGQLEVEVSDDGSTIDKRYNATTALDTNTKTMLAFTWDGTSLRLYYNDTELTGAELNKAVDNSIGTNLHNSTHVLVIGDQHHGKIYETRLYDGAATPAEIATIAGSFGLSGLPGGAPPPPAGGNLPTTLQEMKDYLAGKGIAANDIFYADAAAPAGGNGTAATPWNSIQTASNNLTAGQAVICSGRFYESVTLQASGTSGNLIWYAGDPEDPCIIDGSQAFNNSWTDQGSNRWRASYNLTRDWSRLDAYHNTNCGTSPPCIHESVAMAHTMIHDDVMLTRVSQASVPATMNQGEVFFETGTGDYDTPQYVWVRLTGDQNPNSENMRTGRKNSVTTENPSGGSHLFDWSDQANWPGSGDMTGGSGSGRASGRSFIGIANVHFKHSVNCSRDIGSVNIRGQGWFLEWVSFTDMNAFGFGLYGYNHTLINCKVNRCGMGHFRSTYLQNSNSGTTRIEKCEFTNTNIHTYPIAWEAGNKFGNSGDGGRIEIVQCLFYNINGAGLWWDIDNGGQNSGQDAFLVDRCVFDNCTRWGVFWENNTYYGTITNSGFFETNQVEAGGARLSNPTNATQGQHVSISGSGKCTITQSAFVKADGPGHYGKTEGGGDTQGQNNNTITNNVYVDNGESGTIAGFTKANYIGGDSSTENQTTSTIDGNVFVQGGSPDIWIRNQNGNYSTRTSTLATWEGWHGGTGNAIEATDTNVVASTTNRLTFFDTSGGNYPAKGPQTLVHPDNISEMQWTIPT